MQSTTKFKIDGLSVDGEWNGESKLLLIHDVTGELILDGKFMGFSMGIRGTLDSTLDNQLRFQINSVGGLPKFLIPVLLKTLKAFRSDLMKAVTVDREMLLVNPNLVLGQNGLRILIQPKSEILAENSFTSLRQKILLWTEKNIGSFAKEIVDFVLTIPDLVLLFIDLIRDERVDVSFKVRIGLCVAYVLSPFDLIPEAISGPLGLIDDAAALGIILIELLSQVPTEVLRSHWRGRDDVLEDIITGKAVKTLKTLLPSQIWQQLLDLFGAGIDFIDKKESAATAEKTLY